MRNRWARTRGGLHRRRCGPCGVIAEARVYAVIARPSLTAASTTRSLGMFRNTNLAQKRNDRLNIDAFPSAPLHGGTRRHTAAGVAYGSIGETVYFVATELRPMRLSLKQARPWYERRGPLQRASKHSGVSWVCLTLSSNGMDQTEASLPPNPRSSRPKPSPDVISFPSVRPGIAGCPSTPRQNAGRSLPETAPRRAKRASSRWRTRAPSQVAQEQSQAKRRDPGTTSMTHSSESGKAIFHPPPGHLQQRQCSPMENSSTL